MNYWEIPWQSGPPDAPKVRVWCTKAWLRESGPTYSDAALRLIAKRPDVVTLEWESTGVAHEYLRGQMSYASWLATRQAKPGNRLALKIRTDRIANA